jgi:putative redox protein
MRTVTVTWDRVADRFRATGTHRGHVVDINAPGRPDAPHAATGFAATELLLAGAGSCAAWDVVEILRKQRQDLVELEVRVEGEQDADPPWAYHAVTLRFALRGTGIDTAAAERAVALSVDRYCSVTATLRGIAAIRTSVEVVEPSEPAGSSQRRA